jgi:probable selenium-dependent hydroxylase accessory protein YqeC
MEFEFIDPWHSFLPREGGHVISVVGGGGKTSLLEAMAECLVDEGHKIIVTTTTRTEPLDWRGLTVVDRDDPATVVESRTEPLLFIGRIASGMQVDGKWHGLTPDEVDALGGSHPGHIVLVEADGSAGLPVKLHRDDEPPLPARTSLLMVVVGLSALEQPIARVLHRADRLPHDWLSATSEDGTWLWPTYTALLTHANGYLERLPDDVPKVLTFLQMDDCTDSIGMFGFLGEIMEQARIPLMMIGDTSGPTPRLRVACPREEGDDESAS